jgi:hypothetical protein
LTLAVRPCGLPRLPGGKRPARARRRPPLRRFARGLGPYFQRQGGGEPLMTTNGVSGMVNPVVFGIAVALAQYRHCPEGLVMIHRLPPSSEEGARHSDPNGGRGRRIGRSGPARINSTTCPMGRHLQKTHQRPRLSQETALKRPGIAPGPLPLRPCARAGASIATSNRSGRPSRR